MIKSISILLLLSLFFKVTAQKKFELVWQDNFDASHIDSNLWSNSFSWGRTIVTNHEQEFYTDGNNFKIKKGTLTIRAKRQTIVARINDAVSPDKMLEDSISNKREFKYTSGMLRTKEKYSNGKFEIRCKMPHGEGTWPAFWLYGGNCGEIDIFEKPWNSHRITNNLHYDSAGVKESNFQFSQDSINTDNGYHIYSITWTADEISWFIDGIQVRSAKHQYNNCPMELIINLALANDNFWGHTHGKLDRKSALQVDYVKVYKLVN